MASVLQPTDSDVALIHKILFFITGVQSSHRIKKNTLNVVDSRQLKILHQKLTWYK